MIKAMYVGRLQLEGVRYGYGNGMHKYGRKKGVDDDD